MRYLSDVQVSLDAVFNVSFVGVSGVSHVYVFNTGDFILDVIFVNLMAIPVYP